MNICIVNHRFIKGDGQARVNYEIAKVMLEQGYRLTLVASDVAPELLDNASAKWIPIGVNGWPSQFVKNQIFALKSTFYLARARRQFDLILVNGFITWARSDINAVHFVHGSWLKSAAHPYRQKKNGFGLYQLLFTSVNAALEKIAFRRTKRLIAVSVKVKDELAGWGFDKNVCVISNGVDPDEFYPRESSGDGSSRFGLPADVPVALFAGDIRSTRKNLDTVLKALRDVDGLHLAVAGATEGSPFLHLAEQLGVGERVHFLGFRKDIPNVMRQADFFVFPSRYEACTLAVIEALASGLPVITTYQSGVSEMVVGGGEAGIVLDDAEDVDGLKRAMRILADDKDLRRQWSARARETALQQTWESMARRYMDLCEETYRLKSERISRVLAFATQGSHGDDENRLRALLSRVPADFYPFSKQSKHRNLWRIFRYIRRERPPLVVMEGTGLMGGLAVLLGRLIAGVPYVIGSGDAVGPYIGSKHKLLGPMFHLYEKALYKRAAGFIGWTPYLAGRALTYGTKYSMTAAGWAPFTLSEQERRDARSSVRRRFGIPDDQLVIGIVGSLNWNSRAGYCYGYELVQALKLVNRSDVAVLIVGDGSGKAKLEQLAAGDDRIRFTGRVDRAEVPAILSAMDLASLPQSVDSVGSFRYTTKLSEYLAASLPIVTGRIPLSYDFGSSWLYRLSGSKPWESGYIQAMAGFLSRVSMVDVRSKSAVVPKQLSVFDKEAQIENVTEFIRDILVEEGHQSKGKGDVRPGREVAY
ncbi:glycosyltransferase [Cohnella lubricantis]|uniref:Glycosyltransferase n=1 Tax=Cohnella lubricantis TaxID=2163172 RepID=A0A841T9Z3_9BACL|nr:glycosyltransferase [Cohnella lubricantis]MBB6676845.1 glycosyltransferase [Cohnella lubricantis]MBP2119425.1 glycosyltransferase involved in cell wall biosynthesis [Cohnella lubricantis]